jgi:hypothetical protein
VAGGCGAGWVPAQQQGQHSTAGVRAMQLTGAGLLHI